MPLRKRPKMLGVISIISSSIGKTLNVLNSFVELLLGNFMFLIS